MIAANPGDEAHDVIIEFGNWAGVTLDPDTCTIRIPITDRVTAEHCAAIVRKKIRVRVEETVMS